MDDLIRRQDAIEILGTQCNRDYGKVCGKDCECIEYMALRDMPSAQQWIPCSERLPEEDGDYLVCYEEEYRKDYGFPKIGIAPYEVDSEHFGVWTEEFDSVSMGSLGSEFVEIDVDAWMPLPEPYKEGENG